MIYIQSRERDFIGHCVSLRSNSRFSGVLVARKRVYPEGVRDIKKQQASPSGYGRLLMSLPSLLHYPARAAGREICLWGYPYRLSLFWLLSSHFYIGFKKIFIHTKNYTHKLSLSAIFVFYIKKGYPGSCFFLHLLNYVDFRCLVSLWGRVRQSKFLRNDVPCTTRWRMAAPMGLVYPRIITFLLFPIYR